jgi:hypothetical protein
MPITNQRSPVPEDETFKRNFDEVEADFRRELQEIEAEAIGWSSLAPGTYMHTACESGSFIEIVGQASVGMAADNVLWLV